MSRLLRGGAGGKAHRSLNYGRGGNKAYDSTLRKADEFLTSLGYLNPEPTLQLEKETQKQ